MLEVVEAATTVEDQPVVYSVEAPRSPTGGLAILRGNLAPDGAVIKVAGHGRGEDADGPRAAARIAAVARGHEIRRVVRSALTVGPQVIESQRRAVLDRRATPRTREPVTEVDR